MRKVVIFLLLTINGQLYSQPFISFKEVQDVDSIAHSRGACSCFADLYIKTMGQLEDQLKNMDAITIGKIRKLELNFSNYFTNACNAFNDGKEIDKTWITYFKTLILQRL